MDNPFKKLVHPPKEAPEKLKEKVMADIAAFKLFKDFAGLFLIFDSLRGIVPEAVFIK